MHNVNAYATYVQQLVLPLPPMAADACIAVAPAAAAAWMCICCIVNLLQSSTDSQRHKESAEHQTTATPAAFIKNPAAYPCCL
jgi:hypothetical protein